MLRARHLLIPLLVLVGLFVACTDETTDPVSPTDATVRGDIESLPADKTDGNIYLTYNPVISGTSNIGIILCEFTSTQSLHPAKSFQEHPEYADDVLDIVVGPGQSLDQLYAQMTGHLADPVRFTADVGASVVIDDSLNGPCEPAPSQWHNAARNAAVAQGMVLEDYDMIMVIMSTDNTCATVNFRRSQAFFSSPPAVVISTWDLPPNHHSNVISHEVGHLLGFGHSNNPQYTYWDYSCTMGENTDYSNGVAWVPDRHLNVIWKLAAGYIDADTEMLRVDTPGATTAYLAPHELAPTDIVHPAGETAYRAIRVDTADEIYYVSYRQPMAPFSVDRTGDSALERVMFRVLVHRFISDDYPHDAELVATLQADPDQDTFVADGVTIVCQGDGLDADVDHVPVSITLPDCDMGFTTDIGTDIVYTGTTPRFPYSTRFTVAATSLNSPDCGTAPFSYMLDPGSQDWLPNPALFEELEVAGGGTINAPVSMVFMGDPGDGVYTGTVLCGMPGQEDTEIPVTWVLDREAPPAPYGLQANLYDCTVSLTWNPAVDATSGVDFYRVYRDGQLLDEVAGTSYADALVEPANGASLTYRVTAVDMVGHESDLSSAAVVDLPEIIISNIVVDRTNALDCTITVHWQTNLPASSRVLFGSACGELFEVAEGGYGTSHTVVCDVYDVSAFAFSVISSDGCVTAASDCQQRARGRCIAVQVPRM